MPKAPLCPIRAQAPLELIHIDFTSVELTMELNKLPSVKNVLVITDHLTWYALAVVMKDQTAKTMVKILYEWFITLFSAPTKLLSDHDANFTSALVVELCAAIGIQKCQTTAYHVQCNRQVDRFHQSLFRMIGKLVTDKKAQWEQHLPELLQAYNSMQSVVTGYSLHYLMFGRCLCLPVDFYLGTHVHSCRVPTCVEEVRKCFKEAYAEAQLQSISEADWQKHYYNRATSTVQLMPGHVILMKGDAFQSKRKVKDWWSEVEYVVVHQVTNDMPMYEVRDDGRNAKVIHHNWLFLVAIPWSDATPLGGSESLSEEGATRSALAELTPLEMESEVAESEVDEAVTLCLTSHILLRWVDGVLWPLPTVALRPILRGLGTGHGMWSLGDEEVQ